MRSRILVLGVSPIEDRIFHAIPFLAGCLAVACGAGLGLALAIEKIVFVAPALFGMVGFAVLGALSSHIRYLILIRSLETARSRSFEEAIALIEEIEIPEGNDAGAFRSSVISALRQGAGPVVARPGAAST